MRERAIGAHKTATSTEPWDSDAILAAIPEDAGAEVLAHEFAWVDPEADPDTLAAYKFPHHDLVDGVPGPANLAAASAGIGALNGGRGGADIAPEDRAAVYKHLAAHIKDAGNEAPGLAEAAGGDPKAAAAAVAKLSKALDDATKAYDELEAAMGGEEKPEDEPEPKPDEKPAGDGEPAPAGSAPPFGGKPGEAFDPKNRGALEALAEAMLKDAAFAGEVQRVATSLAPTELQGDYIALTEKAVRADNSVALRIIQPGWGSSGYYSPELLERDGPGIFTAGTKMYWNHQTEAEERERPEGDLRNLAGELLSDSRYEANGPEGPGLYADAKVFGSFQPMVEELAPHIGVSIRAMGKASMGTAEGREGAVIDQLTAAQSVDFVTEPGAGGKVLQLFEAAGRQAKENSMTEADKLELTEARTEAARAREALAIRQARDLADATLAESKLPDATRSRVLEATTANPAIGEDGKLDEEALATAVAEAIKAEAAYLAEVTGSGKPTGMGSSTTNEDTDATEAAMAESFQAIGMNPDTAKIAAAGR